MVTLKALNGLYGFICLRKLNNAWYFSRGAGEVAGGHVGAQQGTGHTGHEARGVGGKVDVVCQELPSTHHAPPGDLMHAARELGLVDGVADVADPGHHRLVHLHLLWDKFSSLSAKRREETDCKP